jgi:hypothetical protein
MLFKSKSGTLRIYDGTAHATSGASYLSILFSNADMSFPVGRKRCEELLNLDRGNADTNMSYSEGPDDAIMEPLPLSFSGRIDDQTYTKKLIAILSGATVLIGGTTPVTTKGTSYLRIQQSGVTTKQFADASKLCYTVQVLYDGASDLGWKIKEVYFPPDQQTVKEGADNVTMNMNGLIYGSILTISSFTSGLAFAGS